jgi:hypothetical protein
LDCSKLDRRVLSVGTFVLRNTGSDNLLPLRPAASLLIGIYTLGHGTDLVALKFTTYPSWLATVEYLIAGSFGGP